MEEHKDSDMSIASLLGRTRYDGMSRFRWPFRRAHEWELKSRARSRSKNPLSWKRAERKKNTENSSSHFNYSFAYDEIDFLSIAVKYLCFERKIQRERLTV